MTLAEAPAFGETLFQQSFVRRTARQRPLQRLSDFVVEDLPQWLLEATSSPGAGTAMVAAAARAAADVDDGLLARLTASERELACLDLSLLCHGLAHHSQDLPEAEGRMFRRLCAEVGRLDA